MLRRLDFWLMPLLFGLTVALLLFPTSLQWQYQHLQSPDFFQNVRLFAVLYYLWLGLLLFLIIRARSPAWGLALAALFALVHLGFLIIHTPQGRWEDWQRSLLDAAVLLEGEGKIDFTMGGYFEFPAAGILGASVASVTGLEIFDIRTPLLLWYVVTLAALLFALYRGIFGVTHLAAFAVLLAIQSNMVLTQLHFHPAFWGILPIIAFLLVLNRRNRGDALTTEDKFLVILLMGAATISHFVSSMVIVGVAAGVYVVQKLRRRRELIALGTLGLFVVMPLAWEMYWAIAVFRSLTGYLPQLADNLARGELFFQTATITRANVVELPLWVTAIRSFWWVLVYLLGALIALGNLARMNKLSLQDARGTGALLGLGAFCAAGTLLSPGGIQFNRYIMYGSFLAVPVVLAFVVQRRWHKLLLPALLGVVFLLSFPTILAHNSTISSTAHKPSDHNAGQFVGKATGGDAARVRVFGDPVIATFDNPSIVSIGYELASFRSADELSAGMRDYVSIYLRERDSSDGGQLPIFLFSDRLVTSAQHLFGILPDDPLWTEIADSLGQASQIYDSGRQQICR